MTPISALRKKKDRHIVVISAGSAHSGIQALSLRAGRDRWDVLKSLIVPYSRQVSAQIEQALSPDQQALVVDDLAHLDHRLSQSYMESASSLLALLPRTAQKVDVVVLNPLVVWKGTVDTQGSEWDLRLGDPQVLATLTGSPVLTDFLRHSILANRPAALPLEPGTLRLAERAGHNAVFLNLGLSAHLTIISTVERKMLVGRDIGPATSLLNTAAQEAGCVDGFDRDGIGAAGGSPDTTVLEALIAEGWIEKMTSPDFLPRNLLEEQRLQMLPPPDRLATVTALVARMIVEAYKRSYTLESRPDTIWVSGGGANNLVLVECLAAYLSTVAVRSVEELGVPVDCRFPVALGLTVSEFLDGKIEGAGTGIGGKVIPLGRWVFP